jgi:hypothetical protein
MLKNSIVWSSLTEDQPPAFSRFLYIIVYYTERHDRLVLSNGGSTACVHVSAKCVKSCNTGKLERLSSFLVGFNSDLDVQVLWATFVEVYTKLYSDSIAFRRPLS